MDNRLYIFLDTEFTNLSRKTSMLVSTGLTVLSEKKESFYAEFNDYSMLLASDFVKENVLPLLTFKGVNQGIQRTDTSILLKSDTKIISELITSWLYALSKKYNKKLTFVVDVGAYDWLLFSELISKKTNDGCIEVPDYIDYIPIDVSTMLYLAGYDTDISRREVLGITEDMIQHNSLFDAKMTHMLYALLMDKFFGEK